MQFPYLKNNSCSKKGILCKILFLGLLIVFSLSVSAQTYTVTAPSLLIKDKSYTFSVKTLLGNPLGTVNWNFGAGAEPSTSNQPTVNVKYATAGIKQIRVEVRLLSVLVFSENRQIYVSEMPDNIEEIGCYIEPEKTNWQPKLKSRSDGVTGEDKVHILAQPFVGDIDGDGISEVVTTNRTTTLSSYTYSNRILIFDQELKLKRSISTPTMYSNSATPIVLLRLNKNDTEALIVIATAGNVGGNPSNRRYRLQAYKPDGTLMWTSNEQIFSTTNNNEASICLVAGDINNDGIPEILAGDRIFNAQTGFLVSSLPTGSRGFRNLNSTNPTYMPLLADMDNDGQLEVVAGNTIYKVTNTNGSFRTTGSILAQVTTVTDGFVSVADINMDGQLDVVLINGATGQTGSAKPKLTVWTLKKNGTTITGEIIAGPVEPSDNGAGGSRVFIGNVDNDIEPELFFSYASRLVRFDYNKNASQVANKLQQTWITTTSDLSGGTTLSMFDFDQDGKAELVYRDQTDLRIIDGSDGSNRETFPCYSATHSEYPVVVDFNGDGHADILVSGAENEDASWDRPPGNADVRIYWFSGEDNDWAPARTVWNQHGYNTVHVNEDLTIPRYQLNPSTVFAGPDQIIGTTDDVYPYNCFLQQQTSLSADGVPFYKAAKAEFLEENVVYDYNKDTDILIIRNITIKNSGDAVFTGPMKITVYKNQVENSPKSFTRDYPNNINIGETVSVDFNIENFSAWLPVEELVIRVNDAGDGKSFHRVCDETDVENTTDAFMYIPLGNIAWADGYRKCENGKVVFQADEKFHNDKYDVKYSWFRPSSESPFSTDSIATLTGLQLSDGGKYVFQAEVKEHLNVRVTLPYLSVAPVVMYWRTDAVDGNWNNIHNWAKSAALGDNISAVPSVCTRVYLPDNAAKYPSLKDEAGHTDWSHYGQPEAKEIVFRYGSELHYQHKLKYEKAYVSYNWGYYGSNPASGQPPYSWENARKLARDTWHILAAPLKSMASGDFSLAGYPFSWQKRFEVTTTGGVAEGDFSLAFPTNDVPLAGNNNAIAVRMAGYGSTTGYSNHKHLEGLHGVIEIPYFENKTVIPYYPGHNYDSLSKKSYFYYFDTKSLKLVNSPLGAMSRAEQAYRFVYETGSNELPPNNTYIMPLNIEGLGNTREIIMVGNPLLAPIDAGAFAGANTNAIVFDQGYKLLSDDGSTWQQHYFTEGSTIPAWKAFIVTLQQGASTLSFPLEEIPALKAATVSTTIRALNSTGPADNTLTMHILKEGVECGDHAILQNNQHTNDIEIRKMILPEGHKAPEVFFMSSGRDLSYLIRNLTQGEKEIPIGVKTSDVHSRLSLEFRNIHAFTASTGAKAILVDKHLDIRQDLTRDPVYLFTQQASRLDKQYVDKSRFVLQLGGETGTIEQDNPENGINVIYRSGILKITSDENIDTVSVYDLYGQLVFSAHSIHLSQYTYPVSLRGKLFLVRVKTISGTVKVKKIMGD